MNLFLMRLLYLRHRKNFFIDEGATGIQRTVSNDSKSFRTYNLNGYEQNRQQRGLNIIKKSDGTVKKVIVK